MDITEVLVDFQIPYLLQVEDSLEGNSEPFHVAVDGTPAAIYFKKIPKSSGGPVIAGQMIGDRLGNVSETAVRVHFDERLIDKIPQDRIEKSPPESLVHQGGSNTDDSHGFIVEAAVAAINRFLRVYKYVTVSYWMRNLLPYEIFSFRITEFKEDGEEKERTYNYSNSPYRGFGQTVEQEEEEEIRSILRTEEEQPIYPRLELETLDKISLGEYNLAVLNTQRLFEIWVKHACLLLLEKEYDEERAHDLMTDDGEYVALGQTFNYFNQHFGHDFRETEEYDRWDRAYKQIRCEVAHAEYMASNQDANEMYEACQELQLTIYGEFKDDLEDTSLRSKKRDVPKKDFPE